MESVIIRPFTDDDLAGAAAALVEVHDTDGYPVEGVNDPEAWIKSEDVLAAWVAEGGGRIVGHVAVMKPQGEAAVDLWVKQSDDDADHVGVLARLFVVQSARKQAAGRRLMEAAVSHARTHGLRLVLDVMVKDASAIRLYERLGWRKIGETIHHFGSGETIPAVCYVSPTA
ncbi:MULTISPECIES: N-acetyltransferase [unclassified Streptomyces]|uniref:GNAT family N-acetyltransferase n=1 Tax=unclassified Streptomyces TaxID=2593676 RepID=UPI0004C29F36|nr:MULTISPECIES: GNAT family N-acetyltransferase [unclassified Streptomyces]KOT96583.1 acetyltransferase [Streptomyces sp. NRRL F-4711]